MATSSGIARIPAARRGKDLRVGASITGSAQWEGPVVIGNGWQGFTKVVARLPSAGPVVR